MKWTLDIRSSDCILFDKDSIIQPSHPLDTGKHLKFKSPPGKNVPTAIPDPILLSDKQFIIIRCLFMRDFLHMI